MENNNEWEVLLAEVMSYLEYAFNNNELDGVKKLAQLIDTLHLFHTEKKLQNTRRPVITRTLEDQIIIEQKHLPDRVKFLKEIIDYYASTDQFERCIEINKLVRFYNTLMITDAVVDEDVLFSWNAKYSAMTSFYISDLKTDIKKQNK